MSEIQLDIRDALIICNIISMVGGAFYLVGMMRTEVRHLANAIERLRLWLEKVDNKLTDVTSEVAVLRDRAKRQ